MEYPFKLYLNYSHEQVFHKMFSGEQDSLLRQRAEYSGSGEDIIFHLKDGEYLAYHLRSFLLECNLNSCSRVCVFEKDDNRDILAEVFSNLDGVSPNVKKRLEKNGKLNATVGEMIKWTPRGVVKYLRSAEVDNINRVLGKRFGLEGFWKNTNTFTYYSS